MPFLAVHAVVVARDRRLIGMPADRTPTSGHALGIDFGTSHTVAVVRWPDGRARPLLVDGSPLLPSAVYAEPGGDLVVGRDAVHSARLDPARFEPNPKRRIDDGTLLLGDRELPVGDLVAAVFARVAEEWDRTVGRVRPEITLTCPATWGATRRRLLAGAAASAGFTGVRLVAEPVAAATYFAKVLGRDVPIGSVVVVHDFGAGTFDASVVARKSSGFEVLAVDGRDDIGGLDVDATIITYIQETYADRDPAAWARLANPSTVEERRAKRQLWDDVRVAKERLSRSPSADLMVPLLDLEIHLTRDELERLAAPLLDQTVRVTQGVMRWANLRDGQVAGVFLVGGSSRMPLMATLLHRALGEAPEVIEQPELVVAEGSILAGEALLATAPPAPGPTALQARIPAGPEATGPARPVSPATPPPVSVSPAPVSVSPAQPAAFGGALPPTRVEPLPAASVEPLTPPGTRATPAPPASAPPTTASQPTPAAQPRTVGRVIVPGAQPPGRSRSQAAPPPAATRPLPRFEQPAGTRPLSTPPPAPPPPPPALVARPISPPPRPVSPPPRMVSPAPRPSVQTYASERRPGRLARTFRTLFILALLIIVPVVAGVIAFASARSQSPVEVIKTWVDWLGERV
ncbi:hypothetical protein GCM10023263_08580 [Phytohabitans rumicis]